MLILPPYSRREDEQMQSSLSFRVWTLFSKASKRKYPSYTLFAFGADVLIAEAVCDLIIFDSLRILTEKLKRSRLYIVISRIVAVYKKERIGILKCLLSHIQSDVRFASVIIRKLIKR